jgi:RNA-binding protein YlmH
MLKRMDPYQQDSNYKTLKAGESINLGPVDCSGNFQLVENKNYIISCDDSIGFCPVGVRGHGKIQFIEPQPVTIKNETLLINF